MKKLDHILIYYAEPILATLAFIGFVVWCIRMVPK